MLYSMNQTKAALGEVQSTHRWAVYFKKSPAFGDLPEDVQIRCQSSSLPNLGTPSRIEVSLQSHDLIYNGKTSKKGEITLGFLEGTDATVFDYFAQWMNEQSRGDGSDSQATSATTTDLQADIRLQLLDGEDNPTQTYDLTGCLGHFTPEGELGQDAGELKASVTVAYEKCHFGAGSSTTY